MVNNYNPDPTAVNSDQMEIAQAVQTLQQGPQTYNPGIKPSGAPVSFNPQAQQMMTNMFGQPMIGSYDRSLGASVANDPTQQQY